MYDQRVRKMEHGSFTPLVFSAAGGSGPAATIVLKDTANMLSLKYNQAYSVIMRIG